MEDIRRALELALEQGLGRETAVIYGNLSAATWFHSGPQTSLSAMLEAVEFCERRGITELAIQMRAGSLRLLAELGQTEEALAELGPTADRVQAMGDKSFIRWRGEQLRLLAERGTLDEAPDPDHLVAAARAVGEPQLVAAALADAAELLLARNERRQAQALLRELGELAATRADLLYSSRLPSLLRVGLALDDLLLAERLVAGLETVAAAPLDEHALASARAQLAEVGGANAEAATLYAEAAEGWRQFGNVPERAYALLGNGRCLAALGDPEAETPLREARELFASMGYRPALAETEALLGESEAAAV